MPLSSRTDQRVDRPPAPRGQLRRSIAVSAFLIIACALPSGCLPLRSFTADQSFSGLNQVLSDSAEKSGGLRLLIVHGMGNHDVDYSAPLTSELGRKLGLSYVPDSEETVGIAADGVLYGYVRTKDFADDRRRLRVYEVTWSPITESLKAEQFRFDARLGSKRSLVNRSLKNKLLNEKLSDAVLYAGDYRANMQLPIKKAVRMLLDDGVEGSDRIAIITFSLGSYMTFDTLRAVHSGDRSMGILPQQVELIAEKTAHVYMLANQIPLLQLTTVAKPRSSGSPSSLLSIAPERTIGAEAGDPVRDFISFRGGLGTRRLFALDSPRVLQIVAFTDPNDLLSYPLRPSDYAASEDGLHIRTANIVINVAPWSYLGLAADPVAAHTGWLKSSETVDAIAFGHSSPRPQGLGR